ncbi:MAG: serine/threonine protein kinase [Gemmataceae bacterium]
MSRSAVGRATARVSRYIGNASRIQATGRFLRKQLWAWPIIAAVVFGGTGWWVHHTVEEAMRQQRITDLNAVANATVTAVRAWLSDQTSSAELIAVDDELQRLTAELLNINGDERELLQAKAQAAIRTRLMNRIKRQGFVGFFVVAPGGRIVASDQDSAVGKPLTGYRKEIFEKALEGTTLVSKPFRSPLLLNDQKGELRANLPSMFVITPLRDRAGTAAVALGLRIRPEDQFTKMLQVARFGDSGEVYAFDRNGLMMSESRFDDGLKQMGLLADLPESQSILTVEIRNPGVDMAKGERPSVRRSEQPLTHMAADAVQGHDGADADGYRGYRGVMKVGAWRWLPEFDLGFATELDAEEAFRPVVILRRAFWGLMSLLVLSAVGIFLAMIFIARQQKALQSAALAAKELGQYKLENKLGAGGMGTVYKARHAMLRRPAAVKLLDVDKISPAAIARFEREVQLTATLTHPNTIAIFDYGHTPEGIFYYAMEYLEGMNLDDLVSKFGPVNEGRLLYIVRQISGSLAEAHAAGMVHRDIKPANIVLTRRGGMCDFVKVLDFGLAKSLDTAESANVTSANAMMGTPLYMSPEAVSRPHEVDGRSDVYAVGAVGYFLLTGSPVFDGETVMEICMKHTQELPLSPSKRVGHAVNAELEAILLRCLSKQQNERPKDGGALLRELEMCRVTSEWTARDAEEWWSARDKSAGAATLASPVGLETPSPQSTMAYEGE